jgi:hypothetical protein
MAMSSKNIYLARHGRTYGPFDANEIGAMRTSGEIRNYFYIWEPDAASWLPIESPPPPPLRHRPITEDREDGIKVLCHDSLYAVVSGSLRNISDSGCDFVSNEMSGSPKLGLRTPLWMNILDHPTKRSIDVKIVMSEVVLQKGQWIYRVGWAERPALF